MFGVSLRAIIANHALRAITPRNDPMPQFSGPVQAGERLNTADGGSQQPVFVLGAHDPDDSTARWVI